MKISEVRGYFLKDVPVTPPPFRNVPNVESKCLVEIRTDEGLVGWGQCGHAHPSVVEFVNGWLAPTILGPPALLTDRIWNGMFRSFNERHVGRQLVSAVSGVDVALWDIKAQAANLPLHQLLGGNKDDAEVYMTHGAAYGTAPVYSREELAKEAKALVDQGFRHLKNTVGRQPIPDPHDDYEREMAIREAVGPDIKLAMDGNLRMTLPQALLLCKLTEEDVGISFLEEPMLDNDVHLMRQLRQKTIVPIAAAINNRNTARDLLVNDAVDILQPNCCNDGGYTAALAVAAMARGFNVPLGHGNGHGPHNLALQAGLANGSIIELHYHNWMAYKAIYQEVPEIVDGRMKAMTRPGTGLVPKPEVVEEYAI